MLRCVCVSLSLYIYIFLVYIFLVSKFCFRIVFSLLIPILEYFYTNMILSGIFKL